jgi:molybdopterin-binding protein
MLCVDGEITDVVLGTVTALVTVKVGNNVIESIITKRSAEELNLKKGDKVTAIIKATEVMIQKDWSLSSQAVPDYTFWKVGSLLVLGFLVLALATLPSLSSGQQTADPGLSATLRITGQIGHPLVLHATDLLTLKRQMVNVSDEKGVRAFYEGVPVAELLSRAGVPLGNQLRGARLKLYVVVAASDGYRVVFALAEFDPDFTNRVILLADRRDGHALSASEGPFRIVVPEEKRHARWVRQVMALDVQQAR